MRNIIASALFRSLLIKLPIEKKISFLFNAMASQRRIDTKEKTKKLIDLSNRDNEIYVYADDILCIEASGKDCIVYTTKGKYLLRRKTLKEELREINQQYILRCHKSFAVNLMHVNGFTKTHQNLWVPIFKDNCEANCYISKTYFDEISDMYKEKLIGASIIFSIKCNKEISIFVPKIRLYKVII